MAELTGLEPATSAVTGQRSNQLSYSSSMMKKRTTVDALRFFDYVPQSGSRPIERWLQRLEI